MLGLEELPTLTEEQDQAAQAIMRQLREHLRPSITVGGLAGTGKSTLLKSVVDQMAEKLDPALPEVVSFTGRAVSVLRRKGITHARTLHSLMYIPSTDPNTGRVHFTKVPELECASVIVDEASMLNMDLYMDLMSYNVPVVFVGDHGQLEPIGTDPGIMRNPDIVLKQVHRQAEGSPILKYAHCRRTGQAYDWSQPTEDLKRLSRAEATKDLLEYDQVICGKNATRNGFNAIIRHQLGRREFLEVDDRIICLKNDYKLGVFNGMTLFVENVIRHSNGYYLVDVRTEMGILMERVQLYMARGDKDLHLQPEEVLVADHAYALTCHKMQGGSAERILVFEERPWKDGWNMERWAYTAASRASKSLTWVDPEP